MALNVNDTKFLDNAEIICEEGLSGIDKAVQIISGSSVAKTFKIYKSMH